MGYQPFGNLPGQIKESTLMSFSQLRGGIINAKEIILAGGTKGVIRSQNYNPTDELGWAVFGDGSAFFFGDVFFGDNAIFLGDIYSAGWEAGGGTVPLDLSTVDTGATVGFALDSSEGAAQFMGDIFLGGDLQIQAGGTLRGLNTSGAGIVIDPNSAVGITFPSGEASEVLSASLIVDSLPRLTLSGPFTTSGHNVGLTLDGDGGTATLLGDEGVLLRGDQVFIYEDGSSSAPGLSFFLDKDTGLYRAGTDQLGIAAGGQLGWLLQEGSPSAGDTRLHFWTNSSRRYIFEVDDSVFDSLNFYAVNSSGTENLVYSVVDTGQLRFVSGSSSAPPVAVGNNNTGLYSNATSSVVMAAGGEPRMSWSLQGGAGTGVYIHEDLSDVGNHETLRADRTAGGSNLVQIGYFSSWEFDPDTGERRKDDIVSLADSPRWNRDWFYKIRPIDFRRLSTGEREFGFLLNEWVQVDDNMKYLTTKGDKWGGGPHETAILAATILEVQDLHQRVAQLEAKLGA